MLPAARYLSVSRAAAYAGVCPNTIRRWADDGLLDGDRTPGGHRRIDRESIDRMLGGRARDEAVAMVKSLGL